MSGSLPPAPVDVVEPEALEVPAPPAAPGSAIMPVVKERPDPVPERAAHVKKLLANIQDAKRHWKKDFERMRSDMDFASGLQYEGQTEYGGDRYVLNLVLRHIRLRVASLYAKNPKAVYKRKPRMDFVIWDETAESMQMAMQQMAQVVQNAALQGIPPDQAMMMAPPQVVDLLKDIKDGMAQRQMIEKIGRALELLWQWFVDEPVPNIKLQMKQMVRRTITTGVGYMKLGFQRHMRMRPDQATKLADMTERLSAIERLRAQTMGEDPVDPDSSEVEELRQAITNLQAQETIIIREGPLLDFPSATSIIPDPRTRSLRGWIGTGWIAEEFELSADQVMEIYGVDLCSVSPDLDRAMDARQLAGRLTGDKATRTVRFWQYSDRATGQIYTVAEGWPDYLEEPRAPEVQLEGFFPYYALTFNDLEHEKRIFPPSDVELLRSPQDEYNRTKESLRQHRIANRPLYGTYNGALEEKDVTNLTHYPAHAVVKFNSLKEGQNVGELMQPVPKVPIDPAVYEVESLFQDIQRATGSQEANFGGSSKGTATEASISESSRQGDVASDTDELDETLTTIARDFGQVCLMQMSKETVVKIVGRGGQIWPELTRAEIADELMLEVEAGSSGRPNRDRDLANFERAAPYLMQLPGINPVALAKHLLRLIDDRLDMAEFIKADLPSITAQNAQAGKAGQPGTGDPATDPNQQGAQGGDNAAKPEQRQAGPQPAYGPSGNAVG